MGKPTLLKKPSISPHTKPISTKQKTVLSSQVQKKPVISGSKPVAVVLGRRSFTETVQDSRYILFILKKVLSNIFYALFYFVAEVNIGGAIGDISSIFHPKSVT